MVYANAYSCVVLLAYIEERYKALLKFLQFFGILLISIFNLLEYTCRVNIVAWIYTHLLGIQSSNISHISIEVYIGHKRSIESIGTQLCIDVLQILGFASTLCSETYKFATCLNNTFCLFHTCSSIISVGGSH